jgi:rod shape-determining protein MreB and related proteins
MSAERPKTSSPSVRPSDPPSATLRVGIALGTWRTAVVASNGAREHFGSLVGWPKSPAARKLLGADVLVGTEAFRFRVAVDLARPFESGVVPGTEAFGSEALKEVHLRAAADLVRRAVRLARAAPGERVAGVLAVPARASIESRDLLVRAGSESMTVTEVVPEAWVAGRAAGAPAGSIVVDVGAGATVVCRLTPEPPAERDMVVLPGGGDAIDLDLLARLRARLPQGEFTVAGIRELKERYGCLLDTDSALVGLPVAGRTAPVDVSESVAAASRAPVAGILEAVRSLWPAGKNPEMTLVLAGCGGQLRGLDLMLGEGLKALGGGKVMRVADPVFAGAEGALARMQGK